MELLAERDPEEARKLLDPVIEHMMEAVHRYEGTVSNLMGDGIMALFGAPLAHEGHALRACYAALRMQSTIARLAEALQKMQDVPIRIRIGINSGDVVVRAIGSDLHMDYTAVGQTTHLAARMEQLADPGTILLAPATLQLVEGHVETKERGPMPVKGLSGPVDVYELIGASPARSRLQVAAIRGLTRFVGRAAEVELLSRALERAGSGQGQVVSVVGGPGVGKSRLFWEFTQSHYAHGWLVLESRSVSFGTATSYLPIIHLLKMYFGIDSQQDGTSNAEMVTRKLLSLDEGLRPWLPAILALLELPSDNSAWDALDPPQRRQRISRPFDTSCCAKVKCNRSFSSSRTCTGSMQRRRHCSIDSSTAWRQRASFSSRTIALSMNPDGPVRPITPSSGSTRCRQTARQISSRHCLVRTAPSSH